MLGLVDMNMVVVRVPILAPGVIGMMALLISTMQRRFRSRQRR